MHTQMPPLSSMFSAGSHTEQTPPEVQLVQPLMSVPQVKHMLDCRAYPVLQPVQAEAEEHVPQPVMTVAQLTQTPALRV